MSKPHPYQWIVDEALTKKGAEVTYKVEWDADRMLLRGKMFGMIGENNIGEPIVTLKLAPEHGELMRKTYPDKIIPGYYMNKIHWNSVFLESDVSVAVIKEMIEESYQLLLGSFSKKAQAEILAE